MNQDLTHIWPAVQSELKRAVPEHTYDLWLAPLRPVAFDGDIVVVEAPDGMRSRIAEREGLEGVRGALEELVTKAVGS